MTPDQLGKLFHAFTQADAVDHPQVWRHRPRPRDQPAVLPTDGRRSHRRKRDRRGLHLHRDASRHVPRLPTESKRSPIRRHPNRHRSRQRPGQSWSSTTIRACATSSHARSQGRLPRRVRRQWRGRARVARRAAPRRHHARRHDAGPRRLGGADRAQGRSRHRGHPGGHDDHRR